jgi:type II secretory pathway pseudopilin PulG
MKQRLKPFTISLFLLGAIAAPTFAATENSVNEDKLQNLAQQVNQLQDEIKSLKGELKSSSNKKTVKSKRKHHTVAVQTVSSTVENQSLNQAPTISNTYVQSYPIDVDVPGKSFVSTGPYIGIPLIYSGGNLIINSPSINEDVTLLNMRKSIHKRMQALGRPSENDHAHLLLSGMIEAQATYKSPGVGATSSDIDLTGSELDGYILGPSSWVLGLFTFAYDNASGINQGSLNNNSRTQNSRVFLNKAFITIGDFSQLPVYGTIGQLYVPFGTYSSNMISSPLTKILGRIKARAVVLGYQQQSTDAFYASAYGFQGDTYVGATSRVNNGGVNAGYRFVTGKISGDVGVGFVANLADSGGLQNLGSPAPQFGGFGALGNGSEHIIHRVSALDVHGMLSLGMGIDLLGEYVGALHSFSPADLSANTHGAKPQAVNAEASYTFSAFERPTSVAVGYGKSKDALAIGLPAQRYSVVLNTSWWKDTLQSLEFRHDINYAAGNYASGNGTATTQVTNGSGKSDNAVTAQFDLYF